MGLEDIIFIVELETGYTLTQMIENSGNAYYAKCILALMAHEEGIKDKTELAGLLKVERNTIYTYINRANLLLSTWPGMPGYNKVFKMLYLECNRRRVYLEERPELTLTYKQEWCA